MAMEGFYELTPAQQGERVAALARAALDSWGLEARELTLLKYRENAVFRVAASDGRRYAIRIHRAGYHSDAELRSELQWMLALSADGFDVPELVRDAPRESLRSRLASRRSRAAPGRSLRLDRRPPARQRGERCRGRRRDAQRAPSTRSVCLRPDCTTSRRGGARRRGSHGRPGTPKDWWGSSRCGAGSGSWPRFREPERALLIRARDRVRGDLSALERSPRNYGLIHADFAPENLMVDGSRVRLIDFDDAGYGWHLFEIATTLYFHIGQPYFDAVEQATIAGYRTERDLPRGGCGAAAPLLHGAGLYLSWLGAHAQRDGDRARADADAGRARLPDSEAVHGGA